MKQTDTLNNQRLNVRLQHAVPVTVIMKEVLHSNFAALILQNHHNWHSTAVFVALAPNEFLHMDLVLWAGGRKNVPTLLFWGTFTKIFRQRKYQSWTGEWGRLLLGIFDVILCSSNLFSIFIRLIWGAIDNRTPRVIFGVCSDWKLSPGVVNVVLGYSLLGRKRLCLIFLWELFVSVNAYAHRAMNGVHTSGAFVGFNTHGLRLKNIEATVPNKAIVRFQFY